ncbi:response regulator [Naumannella halotolerans]|uniref:response regulator n=1 Tax=Naumannella halotolerans TaxID=993414 RepID=UPI001FB9C5CA|nr:response regulator transcription factor [Naumannella halotolerans]
MVGSAADGAEALELFAGIDCDVVLMDVRMPGMNGVDATAEIRRRGEHQKVLTTFDLDQYVFDALSAGASGFLAKDTPLEELVSAIRHVHAGDAVVSPSTTTRLIRHFTSGGTPAPRPTPRADHRLEQLTGREREVLMLLAEGLSNAEIATRLVVEEVTVKTHVSRILTKLGLRDRTQAVITAYRSGLVEP